MKKQLKIPKFKNEDEERNFWDTHSPLDYPGEFVEVKEPFEFLQSLLKKAAGTLRTKGKPSKMLLKERAKDKERGK